MKKDQLFDVIIIGGSYAGLAAGMALGRALRNVLIIDAGNPCNRQTPQSHNFLTNDGQAPKAIADHARQELSRYKTVRLFEGFAVAVTRTVQGFAVRAQSGDIFSARKLVLATGIKDTLPAIPGFSESWGISVLHCPYCHGYEVRQEKTGILANGDAGYELSALIANWTSDLTLYTNGGASLSQPQRDRLLAHHISVVEEEVTGIENRGGYIQQIEFADGTRAPLKALYARLPFVQHSAIPEMMGCAFTGEGYIKIDAAHRTTVPGIFACGDNSSRMRTVANAVAMGTATGLMVNKELVEEDF